MPAGYCSWDGIMFAFRLRFLLAACFLGAVSCFAADPGVLLQADRDFAQATDTRGLEGWMEFMAPNAVLLRDQPQVGPKTIRASLSKSFASPGFHLTWSPTNAEFVGVNSNVGYTLGRYEMKILGPDGRPITEQGSYLTTWLKQPDGTWKVVSDIGSPDSLPKSTRPAAKKPPHRVTSQTQPAKPAAPPPLQQ